MKKRYLIVPLVALCITSNVYAITSNDVTYDNDGTTESLTTTLDNLYSELKKYKTGGSVEANQMLEGATGYSKGVLVTGTIGSKGATTYTPGTSNQTIAAEQYLSGAQTIKGDANLVAGNIAKGKSIFGISGTYTSDANATAAQILSGKTAYVNGSKVTGTMTNLVNSTVESTSIMQDATYTYLKIPQAGYYDSSSQVKVLNNSIGLQNPQLLQNNMVGKGNFTSTSGDNLLISYQVPQDGLYLAVATARYDKNPNNNGYSIGTYLCGDTSSHAQECWVGGNGGGDVQSVATLNSQSTNILQLQKGNYINFTIYTSDAIHIEGSRMHVLLLK